MIELSGNGLPEKDPAAFRTIREVSESLGVPQHVLRFWETRFPELKPLQRGGNRRYYRPADMAFVTAIHLLLHRDGYSIKGVRNLIDIYGANKLVALAAGQIVAPKGRKTGAILPAMLAGDAPSADANSADWTEQGRESAITTASSARQVKAGNSINPIQAEGLGEVEALETPTHISLDETSVSGARDKGAFSGHPPLKSPGVEQLRPDEALPANTLATLQAMRQELLDALAI